MEDNKAEASLDIDLRHCMVRFCFACGVIVGLRSLLYLVGIMILPSPTLLPSLLSLSLFITIKAVGHWSPRYERIRVYNKHSEPLPCFEGESPLLTSRGRVICPCVTSVMHT